jgi:hypothetical protein
LAPRGGEIRLSGCVSFQTVEAILNALQSATNSRKRAPLLTLLATLALGASSAAMADPAKGTLTATGKTAATVNVKHAYLVKGPNAFGDKSVRVLVLSEVDQTAHIKSCDTMSCTTDRLESGMTVEFDSGPRLLYWFVANGQRVQASGTAEPGTMALTANTPQKIAGKWAYDASGQGGPRIAIEFDAALLKEFSKAR